MKRFFASFSSVIIIILLLFSVFAQSIFASDTAFIPGDIPTDAEFSPMSGDMINVIIILLCISGTALIIFLLMSFKQKK